MKIVSLYIDKKNKITQNISLIFILSILTYFLIFSKLNFKIMSNVVNIFLEIIVPSLFPFILFSNILISSGYFNLIISSKTTKIIQCFFKVSDYGAAAILFGFLFGYPNGARFVNELYKEKKISYKEGEYLLLFINNGSPAFILSSVGVGMFSNIKIGFMLLLSHIISSIIIGKIYSYKYNCRNDYSLCNSNSPLYNLNFDIITNSIFKTLTTLGIILGFMVIFIISNNYILKIASEIIYIPSMYKAMLLCIMEITSGLNYLAQLTIDLKLLLTFISFFLGFCSLSIIFQIFSCVYNSKFKLKKIIKGKLLHGILSGIITYVLINIPQIYECVNITKRVNLNLFNYENNNLFKSNLFIVTAIFLIHVLIFYLIIKKKRFKNNRLFKGG